MNNEIIELKEDLSHSDLYSDDLAPVKKEDRTWSTWSLAALWVGMAVCIPTYFMAALMISNGMGWLESLIIIGLANIIITVPMVLNGHAGVKYGIPFPVIGRASFGILGVHIPSIVRALVACGWFGIQTWIGGLAIYAIYNVCVGGVPSDDLSIGKFIGFGIFWLVNMYFIFKGTESIKFLELYSAPILLIMGVILIGWGAMYGGGFSNVLSQSNHLTAPTLGSDGKTININAAIDKDGNIKAQEYRINIDGKNGSWQSLTNQTINVSPFGDANANIQLRSKNGDDYITSKSVDITLASVTDGTSAKLWNYIVWLTIMVGFWATMSLSIADITRYAGSQKEQVMGQFIGLPGTMMFYSFVAIFVSCAAVVIFDDLLLGQSMPIDPVSLLARFDNPIVVVVSQIFMIIATLSTNIAANVIAPANAFSNLNPKNIPFKYGGLITGIIGILICPWYLMNEVSDILVFVSGLLGPVLGIMLADYYLVRKTELPIAELYKEEGIFKYVNGFNINAMIALTLGVLVAIIGYFVPALEALYKLSWFTGFLASFIIYYILMKNSNTK